MGGHFPFHKILVDSSQFMLIILGIARNVSVDIVDLLGITVIFIATTIECIFFQVANLLQHSAVDVNDLLVGMRVNLNNLFCSTMFCGYPVPAETPYVLFVFTGKVG